MYMMMYSPIFNNNFHFTGLGILDLHSIENDVLSLSSYFRGWFHDSGTDSEHLHLILPPATRYV